MDLIGLIAGQGWASGVNLYAVTALLGIFGRLEVGGTTSVPEALQRPEVIGVALVLFAIEFVVDKVPYLDNVWDAVHTVIRPLGAAGLSAILAGDVGGVQQAIAATSGGTLAFAAHAAKATARVAVNTSPEPASNILVSVAEDGIVATVVFFAITNPWIALALVVVLLVAGTVVTVMAIGAARRGLRTLRERRAQRRREAARRASRPPPGTTS